MPFFFHSEVSNKGIFSTSPSVTFLPDFGNSFFDDSTSTQKHINPMEQARSDVAKASVFGRRDARAFADTSASGQILRSKA